MSSWFFFIPAAAAFRGRRIFPNFYPPAPQSPSSANHPLLLLSSQLPVLWYLRPIDANRRFRKTLIIASNESFPLEDSEGGSAMRLSTKNIFFVSALLLAAFPLGASESAANSAVAAAPRAYVNCPGIPNVPMTADAEQALPLRQVAILACGEPVSVLADNEGYTAHIRTADGKEGYVARMYLTNAASSIQPR